jgi:hypothetical protein
MMIFRRLHLHWDLVPAALLLVTALGRRWILARFSWTSLLELIQFTWSLPARLWSGKLRKCKWCGSKRAVRFCSRCGRSVKLRPATTPKSSDPRAPGIAQAPGLHIHSDREVSA